MAVNIDPELTGLVPIPEAEGARAVVISDKVDEYANASTIPDQEALQGQHREEEEEDGSAEAVAPTPAPVYPRIGRSALKDRTDFAMNAETAALLQRAAQGDPHAREKVVEANIGLAKNEAYRYRGRSVPLEDLQQVACIGLLKAIDKFDISKGFAFSSYAVPTIRGEILRYFRDNGWSFHVPRSLQELTLQVKNEINRLENEGQATGPAQIAEVLDLPYEKVLEAWFVNQARSHMPSLDSPLEIDGEQMASLGEIIPGDCNEETIIEKVAHNIELERIFNRLPPREQEIFIRRIVLGQTQKEVGEAVGISQMHVSRIVRAIQKGTPTPGQKAKQTRRKS